MRTRSKFRPERGLLFKVVYKDKEFKEKMAKAIIKNRVEPYPDELFTSWLARNATINYLQTPTFVNCYFPEYKNRLLSRDADVYVDEEIATNFARRMLLKTEDVFKTSLRSYGGYLGETVSPNNRNNLISPVKIRGRYPRLKGLRYCPECLREKEYFRKEWRLSFYAVCPEHGSFLVDSCPECGEPVFLTKRKLDIESFNCWNCGFVYKEAESEKLHEDSEGANHLAKSVEILRNGYFTFGGTWYYSVFYFWILKHIARIIYLLGYRNWDILEKEAELHGIELKRPNEVKGKMIEEILTLKEAFAVFTASISILRFPESLKRFIESNDISYPVLKRDLSYIPFWYENIIWKYRKQPRYVTIEEIENACSWMNKNGIEPSYSSLSRLLGIVLERRKRPELIKLFGK